MAIIMNQDAGKMFKELTSKINPLKLGSRKKSEGGEKKKKSYTDNDWRAAYDSLIHDVHTVEQRLQKTIKELEKEKALRLKREREIIYWEKAVEAAEERADYDFLTGLPHLQTLFSLIEEKKVKSTQINNAIKDEKRKLYTGERTVLFLDIDGFKSINDTYGHDKGDVTIKWFAKNLIMSTRDLVGRKSGDEFCIVVEGGQKEADLVIKRIRGKLADKPCHFKVKNGDSLKEEEVVIQLGVSIGSAQQKSGETLQETLNRADEAMYKDKKEKWNRRE